MFRMLVLLLVFSFCFPTVADETTGPAADQPIRVIGSSHAARYDMERHQRSIVEEKLYRQKLSLEFDETPLNEVAAYLADTMDLNIHIDVRALEEIGLSVDTPITRRVHQMSAYGTLRVMLGELDLTHLVQSTGLSITTRQAADDTEEFCFLEVRDFDNLDELSSAIFCLGPDSWSDANGLGPIHPVNQDLYFRHVYDTHGQAKRLIAGLRMVRDFPDSEYKVEPYLIHPLAKEMERIRHEMYHQRTTAEFIETPLEEVVGWLDEQTDFNILVDHRALEDIGQDRSMPITVVNKNGTLAHLLELLEDQYDLTWSMKDDCVMITTPEQADTGLVTRIYPIRDLASRQGNIVGGGCFAGKRTDVAWRQRL